jgi:iron(III) transport system substrate-binding protein
MTRQAPLESIIAIALVLSTSCGHSKRKVIVYTSVDPVFADPVFKDFSRRTGVEVQPFFRVEATDASGFVSLVTAEKSLPQADVFWNGEFTQTMLAKQRGLLAPHRSASARDLPSRYFDPQGYWSCVGGRCRVLLVQTRLAPPKIFASIDTLLDAEIPSHRVGIAYPPSGTTATHAAALYALLGHESAKWYFQRLRARGVRVLDNSGAVRDQVVGWRLAVGLVDSDAACVAAASGGPVSVVLPDQESTGTLLIPSTVALVNGTTHPDEGKKLVDYLLSAETEKRLIGAGYYQFSLRNLAKPQGCLEGRKLKLMDLSLEDIYNHLEPSRADLEQIFAK